MSHEISFVIPPTGEPLDGARVVNWVIKPGQAFAVDDILLEIETDKSVIEIPSPYAGRMLQYLVDVDGRIDAGAPVARLEVANDAAAEGATALPLTGGGDRPAAHVAEVSSAPAVVRKDDVPGGSPGRRIDFVIPPMGEPLDAARLVGWMISPGQTFGVGDILLEIETDKSVVEIPSPYAGRMLEHFVLADGRIDADTPVARLEVQGDVSTPSAPKAAAVDLQTAQKPVADAASALRQAHAPTAPSTRILMTPAARKAIRERHLDPEQIKGTGPSGRITLADLKGVGGVTARAPAPGVQTSRVATRHGPVHVRVWEPAASAATAKRTATVVLIHGMFADLEAWAALALSLSRSGQRVLALDLPAHGESEASASTFEDVVDIAAEALESLGVMPLVLVGHSFGGAVAARLAGRPRLAVLALVLIAPLGLGTEIAQGFLNGVLRARNNAALGRELARLTTDGALPSNTFLDQLRTRIDVRRPALTTLCDAISWDGVQQLSIRTDLQTMACPITILHGSSDSIIPWQHALNAPARAALHFVPQAGHMPQWEASALTTEVILRSCPAA